MWGTTIVPLLQSLVKAISTAFLGLFLIKHGKDEQKLEDFKTEDKQIEKSKKVADHINGMSDSELRELLSNAKHKDK